MAYIADNDRVDKKFLSLAGQFLVATPNIGDSYFHKNVILICSHNEYGAMGLSINKESPDIRFKHIVSNLEGNLARETNYTMMNEATANQPVYIGGPVEAGRGFILLSDINDSLIDHIKVIDGIYLTYHIDILKIISDKHFCDKYFITLGYSSWAPNQLEVELEENAWLTCPADSGILFDSLIAERYDKVLNKIGINISNLTIFTGHA